MNIIHKNKKGFTLIELLVVIAIIGLLSSIVLASLSSARKKAGYAKMAAEINSLKNALEMYKIDNKIYPGEGSVVDWYGPDFTSNMGAALVPKYISQIPQVYGDYVHITSGYEYYTFDSNATPPGYDICGGVIVTKYAIYLPSDLGPIVGGFGPSTGPMGDPSYICTGI